MSARLVIDPPTAVAIGRCLLARERAQGRAGFELPVPAHAPCAWCSEDAAYLRELLDAFNAEAFDERHGRWRHPDVELFRMLPPGVQAGLVGDAAGEPAVAPAAPAPDRSETEPPQYLTAGTKSPRTDPGPEPAEAAAAPQNAEEEDQWFA